MGDAFRDRPLLMQTDQRGGFLFPGEDEFDLPLGAADPSADVGADRLFQSGDPFRRIVKIGNGFDETTRQVDQIRLELSECVCRLIGLFLGFENVETFRVFDEEINAPAAALLIADPDIPVERGNQGQRAAGVAVLRREMPRHAADVLHQRSGIVEHLRIQALEDIADPAAGLIEDERIGVVDMSAPVRLRRNEVARDGEAGAELLNIRPVLHAFTGKSCSG